MTFQCDVSGCQGEPIFHATQCYRRRTTSYTSRCATHRSPDAAHAHIWPTVVQGVPERLQVAGETCFDVESLVSDGQRSQDWFSWFTLREASGGFQFSIFTGVYEFWALHSALQHTADQRPLTHAALLRTIDALGATLKSVIIDRLIGPDPVFGANLRISHAARDISVDVRPSDAVILAVRTNVPIFVNHNIFVSEMR